MTKVSAAGFGARPPVVSVAPAWAPQTLARGAPVLRQGEPWQRALLMETGLVRMHFLRRDGKEFNKNFFAEGALVCPITDDADIRQTLDHTIAAVLA